MRKFSIVKIVSLNKEFIHSEKSFGSRTPQVGDIGTIVDVYDGAFDIECCDENGVTLWLELFEPSHGILELVDNRQPR